MRTPPAPAGTNGIRIVMFGIMRHRFFSAGASLSGEMVFSHLGALLLMHATYSSLHKLMHDLPEHCFRYNSLISSQSSYPQYIPFSMPYSPAPIRKTIHFSYNRHIVTANDCILAIHSDQFLHCKTSGIG
ncbi:hypothetical protein [Escherichia coli]|nr:hypothetical protein [Escherichia coli]